MVDFTSLAEYMPISTTRTYRQQTQKGQIRQKCNLSYSFKQVPADKKLSYALATQRTLLRA
jgi:hypothetical protein